MADGADTNKSPYSSNGAHPPPYRSKSLSETDPPSLTPRSSRSRRRPTDQAVASLRSSTLLPENATNDAEWFAKRGLMSKKSFKIYKKESKKEKRRKRSSSRVDGEVCQSSSADRLSHHSERYDSLRSSSDTPASYDLQSYEEEDCMLSSKSSSSHYPPSLQQISFNSSDDIRMNRRSMDGVASRGSIEDMRKSMEKYLIDDIVEVDHIEKKEPVEE